MPRCTQAKFLNIKDKASFSHELKLLKHRKSCILERNTIKLFFLKLNANHQCLQNFEDGSKLRIQE